ncbi:MAG: chorismate synthase [Candidatus Margulisbacteria bacterium]|nr:chorismate synthase [Candidatus Margulisiibacteriota bacterium]
MNSFGKQFRMSIFGESHGPVVGCIIDGCPAGLDLSAADMFSDLTRRKSGAKGTTPRKEEDLPEILTGIFQGKTTGAPITIQFQNNNTKSKDYAQFIDMPRPGHADFVAQRKYNGLSDPRGGGHFSGRLTLAIVAAGVVAKKLMSQLSIKAELTSLGGSTNIEEALEKAISKKDSVGGVIECTVDGLSVGLGEPFFDSVESLIAHGVFAIPGIKGIEFGNGFKSTEITGSKNNDIIIDQDGHTATNNCGGINGGITNGNQLVFRVAVKPTASILQEQMTFNFAKSKMEALNIKGSHDLAFVLRVPVIIEAITAMVLADLTMINNNQQSAFSVQL